MTPGVADYSKRY